MKYFDWKSNNEYMWNKWFISVLKSHIQTLHFEIMKFLAVIYEFSRLKQESYAKTRRVFNYDCLS